MTILTTTMIFLTIITVVEIFLHVILLLLTGKITETSFSVKNTFKVVWSTFMVSLMITFLINVIWSDLSLRLQSFIIMLGSLLSLFAFLKMYFKLSVKKMLTVWIIYIFLNSILGGIIMISLYTTMWVFQVSWKSMEPAIHDKQIILLKKAWNDYKRGDIVIFQSPASEEKLPYVKRIIGLPGEAIKIENGKVLLKQLGENNFRVLDEGYLSDESQWKTHLPTDMEETEFLVPPDSYFVLGDFRWNSSDSRNCFMMCTLSWSTHFLKRENIVWKYVYNLNEIAKLLNESK